MAELSPSESTGQAKANALRPTPSSAQSPTQHSPLQRGHSLSLVPGDWVHFGVGQQVWAIAHFHVHHALLRLHLHKLIGDPFDGLPAAPGKGRTQVGNDLLQLLGSSRSKRGAFNRPRRQPVSGSRAHAAWAPADGSHATWEALAAVTFELQTHSDP